jgi:hypothetical protein
LQSFVVHGPGHTLALGAPDLAHLLFRVVSLDRRAEHVCDGPQKVNVVPREGPAVPSICSHDAEGTFPAANDGVHAARHPMLV